MVTSVKVKKSTMLNLLLLYLALIILILCGSYIIYIQNYKCLGMQTLYDYILTNVIYDTIICFSTIALVCTLATFFDFHPTIAKVLYFCKAFFTVHNGISLVSVAVIRYLLIFHSTLFYVKQDEEVLRVTKMANFTIAAIMTLYDIIFIMDFDASGTYQNLISSHAEVNSWTPNSMKVAFSLVIIAFSVLQVRLEIQNYKFGEGFLVHLKRWWTDTHQGETHENDEFGVNFQRIMTLMLSLCVIFFFSGGVIFFKDYPLFGIISVVPPAQLIQIIVIDILWMMIIIQHEVARKKLVAFLKGTNETVQIIQI